MVIGDTHTVIDAIMKNIPLCSMINNMDYYYLKGKTSINKHHYCLFWAMFHQTFFFLLFSH